MSTTAEKRTALSTVTIRPFVDPSKSNMGLEKYGLALFPGTGHEEPIICLENNGVKRYITGLNEFAPEITSIEDEDDRLAAVKEIRTTVSYLEKQLASNMVDPEDKEFWNKVKLLRPNNSEYWDKIVLRLDNDPKFLEPAKNPEDLIILKAIEAGGFSIVAKSLEDARSRSKAPKFYLDKYEETATIVTEVKKIRNKALSALEELYNKNVNKLRYVCKVIDPMSMQYKNSTPTDVLYDNMDKYINGETVERDKKKTAQKFLDVSSLDMETLKLRAIIKDSTYQKLIAVRGDGFIYHMQSSTMMGKNPSEIVEFLKNPLNEDILAQLMRECEKHWNK